MRYARVFMDAMGEELAPVVVTTAELESRLMPLYERLRYPAGQVESMTGVLERRFWEPGTPLWKGAREAARKALRRSAVSPGDVEALIYAGVCRDSFEPATACRIAWELGVSETCAVYDVSNACLGVLNGILEVANRIELGHIRAGLIVTCETAREIVESTIRRMLDAASMDVFRLSLATLTGGSGAAAVVLTDGSFAREPRRRLLGGVTMTAPEHHALCRWGLEGSWEDLSVVMATDAVGVLRHGVALGVRTWRAFLGELAWQPQDVDKVICHQVGSAHQQEILTALEVAEEKDFSTYPYLGNMGTASLPCTAVLAEERDFLKVGDRVGFLGIGSGLNCMMLGWEW
ncbi:3-oxoacyl-ACP synthase III [Planctomycetota bacterium]